MATFARAVFALVALPIVRASVELDQHRIINVSSESILDSGEISTMAVRGELNGAARRDARSLINWKS
jgi:hypothetical protein